MYMVGNEEDSTDKTRAVFLKVRKDDGKVIGRVWLAEKAPHYELDPLSGTLYLKRGDAKIVALKL